jgi:nicotinamidase/pyrazinamidase
MGRAGNSQEEVMVEPHRKVALICVDVQHDFLPGGSLGVGDGDAVIPALEEAAKEVDLVVATRDWHPEDHLSFAAQKPEGVEADEEWKYLWPAHCVAGTQGAEIHPRIKAIADRTISKGENKNVEQYSGVQGTHLADMLRSEGFTKTLVGGLATDYCVGSTALDLLKEGFDVEVLVGASRGITPETSEAMLSRLEAAGATIRR